MDPVLNRKLFSDRSARRRLAEMGGIMASSPALMNEVRTFQAGGPVSEMLGRTQPLPGASFDETTARTVQLLLREARRRLASGDAAGAEQFLRQAASMGSPEAERLLNRAPSALPPPPVPNVDLGGPPDIPRSPGQQVGDVLRGILQPIGERGREIGQPIGEAMRETLQPIGAGMRAGVVGPPPVAPEPFMGQPVLPPAPGMPTVTGSGEPPLGIELLQGLDRRAMFDPQGPGLNLIEELAAAPSDVVPPPPVGPEEVLVNRGRGRRPGPPVPAAPEVAPRVSENRGRGRRSGEPALPPEMEPRGRSAQPPATLDQLTAAPPAPGSEVVTDAATGAATTFGETGDPAKATDAALQSFGVTPASDIKDRVKQYQDLFKELLGESDEDKAQEMWMNLAMVGFAIASGTSPNALQNISAGLLEGSKRMAESRAGARERSDRLTTLALSSAMDEAAEERAVQREEARFAAQGQRAEAERAAERQLQFDLLSQRHTNALALAQARSAPAAVGWLSTDAGEAARALVEEGVKTGRDLGEVIDGLSVIGPDVPQLYRNAMRQVPATGAAVDQAPTTPGTVFYDSVEQQYMIVGEDGVPVPYGE